MALLFGLIIPTNSGTNNLKSANHPNIVFILANDMGFGDLDCYNRDSKIPTPNIDKLAEKGIRFTNAHSPGTWCVPSWYGLITGRYPGRLPDLNVKEHSLNRHRKHWLHC